MQKGQLTQWTQQIWVVGTVTFSAKRLNPTQWGVTGTVSFTVGYAVGAVGVGAKSTLCELTFLHQHLLRTTSSLHGV